MGVGERIALSTRLVSRPRNAERVGVYLVFVSLEHERDLRDSADLMEDSRSNAFMELLANLARSEPVIEGPS